MAILHDTVGGVKRALLWGLLRMSMGFRDEDVWPGGQVPRQSHRGLQPAVCLRGSSKGSSGRREWPRKARFGACTIPA